MMNARNLSIFVLSVFHVKNLYVLIGFQRNICKAFYPVGFWSDLDCMGIKSWWSFMKPYI